MRKVSRRDSVITALYALGILVVAAVLLSIPIRAFAADLDMPVPTAVVYPGQSVLDIGVVASRFRVSGERLSSYVVEEGMLRDKLARRTLLPGKPILLSDLKSPNLVTAGVAATIVYREPGLFITGVGLPLQSAGEGESIRVRNADSGVTITGIVMANGTIEVVG